MEKENRERSSKEIRRNPSRNNSNVKSQDSDKDRKGFELAADQEAQKIPSGTPNSGAQIQNQNKVKPSVSGNPDRAGAGSSYGSGQADLMGEAGDQNENAGTAPGSGLKIKKDSGNESKFQ